jgi:hypothetical protein
MPPDINLKRPGVAGSMSWTCHDCRDDVEGDLRRFARQHVTIVMQPHLGMRHPRAGLSWSAGCA